MSVRYFHAAGNYKGRHAVNDTVDLTGLIDAVDSAITDALAETDIDASLTAEAAVGLIQNAPTQNQIRLALENILRNIENSNEYAKG